MPEPRNPSAKSREELDAVANGGSRGRAAYQESQALIASQKTAAVRAALAEAAQRGAPAGMQAEISSTVGAPYDRQIGNLSQASASRTAELAQLSAGNAAYMGQVAAAGPAMRGALERKVAAQRAQSGGGGGGGGRGGELSDSELSKRLIGAARLEREPLEAELAPTKAALEQTNARRFGTTYEQLKRSRKSRLLTRRVGELTTQLATPVEARARQLGVAAGVDPSRVYGVVGDPEAPKALASPKPKPVDKETAQRHIIASLERSGSAGTIEAFRNITSGTSNLNQALNIDPSKLPRDVDPQVLSDWLRRYFAPTEEERIAIRAQVARPRPKRRAARK